MIPKVGKALVVPTTKTSCFLFVLDKCQLFWNIVFIYSLAFPTLIFWNLNCKSYCFILTSRNILSRTWYWILSFTQVWVQLNSAQFKNNLDSSEWSLFSLRETLLSHTENYSKKPGFCSNKSRHCAYIIYSVKTWFSKNLSVDITKMLKNSTVPV